LSSAPSVKILNGDVLDHLRELPSESVHCCVTSPPYWGLRDYSRCGCAIRKADFQSRPFGSFTDSSGERGDLGCGQYSKPPNPLCPICHGKGKMVKKEAKKDDNGGESA
jgi:DNA modification methylase